jgi:Skp family chaperone for outer membrane proteins
MVQQQGVLNVTKSQRMTVLVGSMVLAGVMVAAAQAQDAARRVPDIALIDVGKLFKNNPEFKQQMEGLQKRVSQAETNFKKERDSIKGMVDQLAALKSGTPEYDDLERQVAKRQSDLNVAIQLQRKEFLKQEAQIYYRVYQQIQTAVDSFAARNGIAAVLKFNSDQPDQEKPDEILRDLNKPVLWYNPQLDITERIRQMVESGGAAPGNANRAAAPSANFPPR